MSKEPNRNIYVGHRYVPKIMGEWDKTERYEGLSIVSYQGNSYTSKKYVPLGIDIEDTEFWVVTGNYNIQIEHYRNEVNSYKEKVDTGLADIQSSVDTQFIDMNNHFDNKVDTVNNNLTDKVNTFNTDLNTRVDNVNSDLNTRIDTVNRNLNDRDDELSDDLLFNSVNINSVNVENYPKLSGETDDTERIQRAINDTPKNGTLIIPGRFYDIKADKYGKDKRLYGLKTKSDITILMSNDTVLQALPSSEISYTIINVVDSENVTIKGGILKGEKFQHTGTNGEWGYGIAIRNSSNVIIDSTVIYDCFGDGVLISNQNGLGNIKLLNLDVYNCRRHELTIAYGSNILVDNCSFTKQGTLKDGIENVTYGGLNIDIEPDNVEEVKNVVISNCIFHDKINACIRAHPVARRYENIKVINNYFYDSYEYITITQTDGVIIENNILDGNNVRSLLSIIVNNCTDTLIHNNKIDNIRDGILVLNEVESINIINNKISNIKHSGINLNDVNISTIENNIIKECGFEGETEFEKVGITSINCVNLKINNNHVENTIGVGLYLYQTNESILSDNKVFDSSDQQIRIRYADNSIVNNNIIKISKETKFPRYVYVQNSEGVSLQNNILRRSNTNIPMENGIDLVSSETAFVTNNDLLNSCDDVGILGTGVFSNNRLPDNTIG